MIRPNISTFSSLALLLGASLFLTVSPAAAQKTDNAGFPKGTIASGNAEVTGLGSSVVYTVPNDRIFVLTTLCTQNRIVLSGSTLGRIGVQTNSACTTVSPVGFIVPSGEVLSCNNLNSGDGSCSVSGILVK